MAIKLTQQEADMLIDMLKKTAEKEIAFPSGKGRVIFDVTGDRREDLFAVSIERKGINVDKVSYQGRMRTKGIPLMRLDVNPTSAHRNPDGEIIRGTHLHVYLEEYEMDYATLFDVESKDLYQLCYTFFERFNIVEPPTVTLQLKLTEV